MTPEQWADEYGPTRNESVEDIVRRAVAEERERCAKIAEHWNFRAAEEIRKGQT